MFLTGKLNRILFLIYQKPIKKNIAISCSYLPETYQEKYSDLLLRENDVVVALNRPITQNKLNIARITNKDLPSILYQRVGKIISLKQIVDKNFSYYLLSDVIFRFVLRGAIGSDQP